MSTPEISKVHEAIATAEQLYHRLVLIVGPSGSGKTRLLQGLADELSGQIINVNLALSSRMLDLTPRQRTTQAPDLLSDVINEYLESHPDSPLLLDNLEILFDHSLHVDPLRLLEKMSRNHTIIATWNGLYEHGKLTYATFGHPEYKNYESVDAVVVPMVTITSAATPMERT